VVEATAAVPRTLMSMFETPRTPMNCVAIAALTLPL
jgi:hypothetical protein